MSWWRSLLDAIPGGSLVNAALKLGNKALGNDRRETKLAAELQSEQVKARARRRRALIKASPWPLRLFALATSMAPFFAPLWPGVEIGDVTRYVREVINGMPGWYVNLVLMEYSFIWGGAEWKSLVAQRDSERFDEMEISGSDPNA